jgi:putative colanic acid biosynthesis acetyltransferase WcaF
LLFRPTPKFLNPWRVLLLRLFGAKVSGRPFVDSSAVVKMPWNLVLEDRACLAPRSEVYNLATVILRARCTVAQEVYLCAGTHDFSTSDLPLVVGEISVGEDAFLCARVFVLPGLVIGEGAVVGACSVVTRDLPAWTICAGNPCRPVKPRVFARKGG